MTTTTYQAARTEIENGKRPVKVTRETLTTRSGKVQGFKFLAHFADGSVEVIRAKATRPYETAYLYSCMVASGKDGWAACFSYGKNPDAYARPRLVATYQIQAA